jgi:hypothetical protein
MSDTIYKGTISFVEHDKQYVTIDYLINEKKKTINGRTDEQDKDKKSRKHQYRINDEVNFQIRRSDRGDKMIAYNIKFLYNTQLEKLINRSQLENRFSGYLKMVDNELFVKEWESYIFFPLKLSKWENPPAESAFNEAISFKLINTGKPDSIAAELFSHDFIPEYRKAVEYFKNKKETDAVVSRVSPFAVYVFLFGEKLQAKIELPAKEVEAVKPGDKLTVIITFLSASRLIVQRVNTQNSSV